METTVLIPNYNGLEHLNECLSSLKTQTYKNFKTILIDNNSKDDSIKFTKANFPEVEILKLNKNEGFAKAINLGIKHSLDKFNPKYVALLNNDTKTDKNWLKSLTKAIKSEANIAAVSSNMLSYYNPKLIDNQGSSCNKIGEGIGIKEAKTKEILAPCFGAALIKTEALKEIGLPDERYFAYMEDLDWGWKANLLGYKLIFEKNAIVYHKISSTSKKTPIKKVYLCKRNALTTIIKNYNKENLKSSIKSTLKNYKDFTLYHLLNKNLDGKVIEEMYQNQPTLSKRLNYSLIPLRSAIWNTLNLKKTLKKRKEIQSQRKIPDSKIQSLILFE